MEEGIMEKVFGLEKNDNDFVESMLFPVKRRAAIRNLSNIRRYQWGSTILLSMLWLIGVLSDSAPEYSVIVLCVVAISASYTDARIKMLKTFERMESLSKTGGE